MSIPEDGGGRRTRTLSITITADTRPLMKALARAEMAFWVKRPDPNPMPRIRLFRWLP